MTPFEIPQIDPTLSSAAQMDSAGAIVTGFIFFFAILAAFAIGKVGQFALSKFSGGKSSVRVQVYVCPCCKRIRD